MNAGCGGLLCGAESSMRLQSCILITTEGAVFASPASGSVYWLAEGCNGRECVMHDALSGLYEMPIASD